MVRVQEIFVVIMTVLFAISATLSYWSITDHQKQIENFNLLNPKAVSAQNDINYLQLLAPLCIQIKDSKSCDYMNKALNISSESSKDYLKSLNETYFENVKLRNTANTYDLWSWITFIAGICFFVFYIEFDILERLFIKKRT